MDILILQSLDLTRLPVATTEFRFRVRMAQTSRRLARKGDFDRLRCRRIMPGAASFWQRTTTDIKGHYRMGDSPARQTPEHRLDSWKEIAAFFGRDERTVRRWEKERGLRGHRVPGGARSAVFAYADESTSEIYEHTIAEQIDEKKPAAPTIALDASASTARVSSAIKSPTAARVAAWTVPLVLAVGLVTYFSIGHS